MCFHTRDNSPFWNTVWSKFTKKAYFFIHRELTWLTEPTNSAAKCLQRQSQRAVLPYTSIGSEVFVQPTNYGDFQTEWFASSVASFFWLRHVNFFYLIGKNCNVIFSNTTDWVFLISHSFSWICSQWLNKTLCAWHPLRNGQTFWEWHLETDINRFVFFQLSLLQSKS